MSVSDLELSVVFCQRVVSLAPPAATSEYYKLLMSTEQDERADATVCSLDELERVTSEHTLKNTVVQITADSLDMRQSLPQP